jgi:pimeloyl-ACP methyl ester carboxylesterase
VKKSPHFEPVQLSKYPIPKGLNAECGYLIVPESRSASSGNFPSSRTLRIYVTIVKSLNNSPSLDPIVFLYGGPGANSGGILRGLGAPEVQNLLLNQGDFIVFDHRGTGFSEPALFAPEVDPLWADEFLKDFDADERAGRFVEAILKARARFVNRPDDTCVKALTGPIFVMPETD